MQRTYCGRETGLRKNGLRPNLPRQQGQPIGYFLPAPNCRNCHRDIRDGQLEPPSTSLEPHRALCSASSFGQPVPGDFRFAFRRWIAPSAPALCACLREADPPLEQSVFPATGPPLGLVAARRQATPIQAGHTRLGGHVPVTTQSSQDGSPESLSTRDTVPNGRARRAPCARLRFARTTIALLSVSIGTD